MAEVYLGPIQKLLEEVQVARQMRAYSQKKEQCA